MSAELTHPESNPLHAKHYADAANQFDVAIHERIELATDTFLVRMKCPELASRITPGQFVMLRSKHASGRDSRTCLRSVRCHTRRRRQA